MITLIGGDFPGKMAWAGAGKTSFFPFQLTRSLPWVWWNGMFFRLQEALILQELINRAINIKSY
jgi:hypothetical protein